MGWSGGTGDGGIVGRYIGGGGGQTDKQIIKTGWELEVASNIMLCV